MPGQQQLAMTVKSRIFPTDVKVQWQNKALVVYPCVERKQLDTFHNPLMCRPLKLTREQHVACHSIPH